MFIVGGVINIAKARIVCVTVNRVYVSCTYVDWFVEIVCLFTKSLTVLLPSHVSSFSVGDDVMLLISKAAEKKPKNVAH